jgi:nucleoside-diphosphate-sugar epimerase
VGMMAKLDGDIVVLGGDGKVGPELVEMLIKADRLAGTKREIMVPSLYWTDQAKATKAYFETQLGVKTFVGDLSDESFLNSLPDAANLIYMVGFKFGSAADPGKTILMNCIVPGMVAMKYNRSRVVNWSSGNPYPHTDPKLGGATEEAVLNPQGIYGYSIIGREMAWNVAASGHKDMKVCHYRLMYAQHLGYGVLVDLAKMIDTGERISLEMPYVNLISQRDAIERSLRGLEVASNPSRVFNVSGAFYNVREICTKLGAVLGKEPIYATEEADTALIANDSFAVNTFGPYRDQWEDMIVAAANWVKAGGEYWNLPTKFGSADHVY